MGHIQSIIAARRGKCNSAIDMRDCTSSVLSYLIWIGSNLPCQLRSTECGSAQVGRSCCRSVGMLRLTTATWQAGSLSHFLRRMRA